MDNMDSSNVSAYDTNNDRKYQTLNVNALNNRNNNMREKHSKSTLGSRNRSNNPELAVMKKKK